MNRFKCILQEVAMNSTFYTLHASCWKRDMFLRVTIQTSRVTHECIHLQAMNSTFYILYASCWERAMLSSADNSNYTQMCSLTDHAPDSCVWQYRPLELHMNVFTYRQWILISIYCTLLVGKEPCCQALTTLITHECVHSQTMFSMRPPYTKTLDLPPLKEEAQEGGGGRMRTRGIRRRIFQQ